MLFWPNKDGAGQIYRFRLVELFFIDNSLQKVDFFCLTGIGSQVTTRQVIFSFYFCEKLCRKHSLSFYVIGASIKNHKKKTPQALAQLVYARALLKISKRLSTCQTPSPQIFNAYKLSFHNHKTHANKYIFW